jgi:glycine cleavage system transcriptional repressor
MSVTPPREQFLVINALGRSPSELASLLYRTSLENRCNVISSRLTRHGDQASMTVQVAGSWDALARLEASLPALAKRLDFSVHMLRSSMADDRPEALPYVVYVSAAWRPDTLTELCSFFASQSVDIESITCDTFQAPQSGAVLLNATIVVTLPARVQISWLRDQFLDFADALNLDALIEPWRPQNP